jgi:hypothetical protein
MFSLLAILPRGPLARFFLLGPLVSLGGAILAATPAPAPALVDDFSSVTRLGTPRFVITDKDLGSQSHAELACADGVLTVHGELVPGRGVPAFISVPLVLAADMKAQDVGAYEGVRLRVKVLQGLLTVQVASAAITNFDYHTSAPVAAGRDASQEVRIPFTSLKRAWSEQTPLDLTTITSVNLVAFGMAKGDFAYEVDEIGFY